MSELYPTNRGYVLVTNEGLGSYGEGSAPTADDVIYCEDVATDQVTDMISRVGLSPERPGFRPIDGMQHGTISLTTECRPKIQTPPLTDDDSPDIDALLRASGWVRQDDDANIAQTYVATSGYTVDSAYVEVYESNSDQAGGDASQTKWSYLGTRFDWSFTWNAGERWMWTFDGAAKTVTQTDTAQSWITEESGSLDYGTEHPLVAKSVSGAGLVNLTGDVVFGGGTVADPSHALAVLSLSASGNMGMAEQESAFASGAVGRVSLTPVDPMTIECVVEQSDISGSDWDPYAIRDSGDAVEVNYTLTATGTGGSTVTAQIVAYGMITGIAKGDSNGRKTWSLTLEVVYPESASDGGATNAAGENPGQTFEAGTNIGLGTMPMAGITRRGLMAIQFKTA